MVAAVGGRLSAVDADLRQFESLRAQRVNYDTKWQLVSDYILTRRDFSTTQRPGQLRPHRVVSSVGTNANTRMAALVLAYWWDITRPNLLPNVKRGLATAGRDTDLDDDGLNYLSSLAWNVDDHMMRPKAQLMMTAASMLKEFCAFGCGVLWTGRRRGFGPYFVGRRLSASWWSVNEEGVIDTLFYRLKMPIYRVLQRWPQTAPALWPDTDRDKFDENAFTDIVLVCRPRQGGVAGAVTENKPFAFLAISEEKKGVLEETGYDSFPYAVFRYDPLPGEAYAEGPGCQVLPDVMVLNHLTESIEYAASQKARPPFALPARMFGKPLDMRPGAPNHYNPQNMGLMRSAQEALLKLDLAGDPTPAAALKQSIVTDIETGYFTDWLRLRDSGDMTAEEVRERRDMRLRGMSTIVAYLAGPTSDMGDRAMDIMLAEGSIPPAPASVANAAVDWEYAGPLLTAQLQGNVQNMLQLINARGLVAGQDPIAAGVVDLEESLRVIANGLASPNGTIVSKAKVQALREQAAHQAEQKAQAEQAATVAGAAKDAGAGVASVAGAMPPPAGGQGAAPFAPAAPFAQAA